MRIRIAMCLLLSLILSAALFAAPVQPAAAKPAVAPAKPAVAAKPVASTGSPRAVKPAAKAAKSADISIDASKVIRTLQTELFGQNVNVYEGSGDGNDPVYNAAVTAMGTNLMRFPGGGYCEFTDWENLPSGAQSWLPIDIAKGIAFAKATNCQLQPCVNADGMWADKKHTVDEAVKKAAKWVKYMNGKSGALYCKYWEVGNENFKMQDYGERFVKFYKAMKKEDPSIKIGAQIQFDHLPWSIKVLDAIKAGGVVPDFFIVHAYPIWFPDGDRFAKDAPNWDKNLWAANPYQDFRALDYCCSYPPDYKVKLDKIVSEHLGAEYVDKIPYWMTEFRSFMAYKFDEYVDTLFCAQFLLEIGRLGWQGSNVWALKNGFSTKYESDFGLLRTGVNPNYPDDNPKSSPWPTYYIYPYLSRVFGRDMVDCKFPAYAPVTEAGNKVRAWASKDSDGNLTVLVVNNDPDAAATANVKVAGFEAGKAGRCWIFESDGLTLEGNSTPILQRRDIKINGVRRPEPTSLPGDGEPIATGNTFAVKLPVASMVLVKVPAAGKELALTGAKLVPGKVIPPSPKKPQPTDTPVPKKGTQAAAAKPAVPAGPDTEFILQEFTSEDTGGLSPWIDEKGSTLSIEGRTEKAKDGSDGQLASIKYKQATGGWAGFWIRAGSDWNGVDCSGIKAIIARVRSKNAVEFGVSMEDEDKNKLEVGIPVKGGADWQVVKVPVKDAPAGFKLVKGMNLFMKSPGTEGTFEVDILKIVKPGEGGAAPAAAEGAAAESLTGGKVVLQDFAADGMSPSPWMDEKGSSMTVEQKDAKKNDAESEDGKVLLVTYKQVAGGWAGFWVQTTDWNGLDCSGAKAVEVRVRAKKSVAIGISMEDEDKNKVETEVPVKEAGKFVTMTVPLKDVPAGFKLVKGMNIYMKSPGSDGSFELDTVKILK